MIAPTLGGVDWQAIADLYADQNFPGAPNWTGTTGIDGTGPVFNGGSAPGPWQFDPNAQNSAGLTQTMSSPFDGRQASYYNGTAINRGFVGPGVVAGGELGGAAVALVGDHDESQMLTQIDYGPLANFVDPLAKYGQESISGRGIQKDLRQLKNTAMTSARDLRANPNRFDKQYQQVVENLRAQAAPYEQQAQNSLFNKLQAMGQMGVNRSGGMQINEFAKGLGMADLARQGQAFDFTRQLNQDFAQRALDRFAVGNQLFQQQGTARDQQLMGGLGALSGFQNIQNYGLTPARFALDSSIAFSNSALGRQSTKDAGGSNFQNVLAGVQAAGQIAGGFAAFSDARLKRDVMPTGQTVAGLPTYTWLWNAKANELGYVGFGYGVMADDVEQKYPDLVGERDGYKTVNYAGLENIGA